MYIVAPTYHPVYRIPEDNGLVGCPRAIPEDDDGVDVAHPEASSARHEKDSNESDKKVSLFSG